MNKKILNCLKQNSRMSWQDIGKKVHLTGQAVATRVKQMEDLDIISGYTIKQNNSKPHFITVFMNTNDFKKFDDFIDEQDSVNEAYKVTGEGCYLIVHTGNHMELDNFLNLLLNYGRYRVSTTLNRIK